MKTREEVRGELTTVIENVLSLDELDLRDDTTANQVEGWDSLGHIRIMTNIEKKFKIRFSNAELEKLKSMGDLIDQIMAKTKA